jgi:predicted amidohydrolase
VAIASKPESHSPGSSTAQDSVDEFTVIERIYCDDPSKLSVGLANIRAVVPDIEANKDKIVRAAREFKERGVNLAVFPEFALSGYFWEDEDACRPYVKEALTENHVEWIDRELQPLLDDDFRAIALNNLTTGDDGKMRNTSFLVDKEGDYLDDETSYDKVFLPGIEKRYTESGRDDRLVVDTPHGKLGFSTCYDYLFSDLLREYAVNDEVDAMIQIASWRAAGSRDYAGMNVRSDNYYGDLWNSVLAAASATNQVWTIACNAVGRHGVTDVPFWGGSGVWAPSGLCLVQASHQNEELVVVHNLDIQGARDDEEDDFDYSFDFSQIYKSLDGSRTFTRSAG